jgi:glycosyltransferase involved in cell wall biosynthesis
MNKTIGLSVIIPVFNEEEVLRKAYSRITQVMEACGEHYELLFVDDGSTDGTAAVVRELAQGDHRVKGIIFSRNFGQQAALSAGIECSSGRGVILIDADLQDPPEVIPAMIDRWKEGYEVVYARRTRRSGETILKRMEAAIFYRLLNSLTAGIIPVDVCDAIKNLPERNRYLRGLVSWVGFKQAVVEYSRQERCAGSSKYFFTKRLRLAADALLSFSNAPLKLLLCLGCLFSLAGLILLIPGIFRIMIVQEGFPLWLIIIASNLFFCGIVLAALSVMSGYIARIYDEAKGRPLYIIAGKIGFARDDSPEEIDGTQ